MGPVGQFRTHSVAQNAYKWLGVVVVVFSGVANITGMHNERSPFKFFQTRAIENEQKKKKMRKESLLSDRTVIVM